jgi:hypothetical protein
MAPNTKHVTDRRHREWVAHNVRWRWLVDSYEGGQTYRDAVYGTDTRSFPVRNLVRHKREYPAPGKESNANLLNINSSAWATDDDYELRRARTPIPTFVSEVINDHLARVYAKEVEREGPQGYLDWTIDVDGSGLPLDRWMQEECGPLLYTLGQIDLMFDHPPAPMGSVVQSQADVERLALDRCVVSVLLPDNVLWWELDPKTRRYLQVLIREYDVDETDKVVVRYRHWTATSWTLYDDNRKEISRGDHPYGQVPIRRIFDKRKPRCEHVGQSRLEATAERQREFYNRDSELVLSDSLQAHPTMQGPEDMLDANGDVPVGPGYVLPMKRDPSKGGYQGWEFIDPPKDAAESIRTNKQDLRDAVDRDNCIAKPAGTTNMANAVAQSGVSKSFDNAALNNRLNQVSDTLQSCELAIAEMVLVVLANGKPTPADLAAVEINYSRGFQLLTAEELAKGIVELQGLLKASGVCPEVEVPAIQSYVRELLRGYEDEDYDEWDDAIEAVVSAQKSMFDQQQEADLMGAFSAAQPGGVPSENPDESSSD